MVFTRSGHSEADTVELGRTSAFGPRVASEVLPDPPRALLLRVNAVTPRAVQSGADLSQWAVDRHHRHRVRHPRVRRLVQFNNRRLHGEILDGPASSLRPPSRPPTTARPSQPQRPTHQTRAFTKTRGGSSASARWGSGPGTCSGFLLLRPGVAGMRGEAFPAGWARDVEAARQSARVQCWPMRSWPKLWCGSASTSSNPARS